MEVIGSFEVADGVQRTAERLAESALQEYLIKSRTVTRHHLKPSRNGQRRMAECSVGSGNSQADFDCGLSE